MKQVTQVYRTGEVKVLDVPAPSLLPHGVLVSTRFSLISAGTERAKVELGRKNLLAKARSRPDQVRQVLEKVRQRRCAPDLRDGQGSVGGAFSPWL